MGQQHSTGKSGISDLETSDSEDGLFLLDEDDAVELAGDYLQPAQQQDLSQQQEIFSRLSGTVSRVASEYILRNGQNPEKEDAVVSARELMVELDLINSPGFGNDSERLERVRNCIKTQIQSAEMGNHNPSEKQQHSLGLKIMQALNVEFELNYLNENAGSDSDEMDQETFCNAMLFLYEDYKGLDLCSDFCDSLVEKVAFLLSGYSENDPGLLIDIEDDADLLKSCDLSVLLSGQSFFANSGDHSGSRSRTNSLQSRDSESEHSQFDSHRKAAEDLVASVSEKLTQYSEANKEYKHTKKQGLGSAEKMKTDLADISSKSSSDDSSRYLTQVSQYLSTYVQSARVTGFRRSGHKEGSLIVKVMQGLNEKLNSGKTDADIMTMAKDDRLRNRFAGNLISLIETMRYQLEVAADNASRSSSSL